jgi:hypothetical protein
MDNFLKREFKMSIVPQLEALSLIDLEGLRKYLQSQEPASGQKI